MKVLLSAYFKNHIIILKASKTFKDFLLGQKVKLTQIFNEPPIQIKGTFVH